MSANAVRFVALDTFRKEWVCGHLDYQRAAESLEAASQALGRISAAVCTSMDDEARCAQQEVENARRRLAEVESALQTQFDRFCSVTR
jgi:hypothetical protein